MKNNFARTGLAVFLTFFAVFAVIAGASAQEASAKTVVGVVKGFACMTEGKACPVDRFDPHMAVEKVFVLVEKGGAYYFITNLDQGILSRNIFKKVRVTGNVNPRYKSMRANSFEVFTEGDWAKVWSQEMEQKETDLFRMGT